MCHTPLVNSPFESLQTLSCKSEKTVKFLIVLRLYFCRSSLVPKGVVFSIVNCSILINFVFSFDTLDPRRSADLVLVGKSSFVVDWLESTSFRFYSQCLHLRYSFLWEMRLCSWNFNFSCIKYLVDFYAINWNCSIIALRLWFMLLTSNWFWTSVVTYIHMFFI